VSTGGRLHAYVAAAHAGQRAALGVVFVDARGQVLKQVGRRVPVSTNDHAAFHGIIYALWTARRLGSRRVVVHSDHPAVVAQVNGRQDVRADLVGPYLEVRALLNAYRSACVEPSQIGWEQVALAMAETALAFERNAADVTDVIIEDLPLWSWSEVERVPEVAGARVPAAERLEVPAQFDQLED
jgi:ribonuclease HI